MATDAPPAAVPLRERADASNNECNKLVSECDGSWFEGVVLCVSGLMWNDRERAVATVCRGGGAYSGSLHKGCTHLAVLAPEGAKYDKAIAKAGEWGIKVVSPAWLWDSASSRGRLNEKSYGVGPTHVVMPPPPPPSSSLSNSGVRPGLSASNPNAHAHVATIAARQSPVDVMRYHLSGAEAAAAAAQVATADAQADAAQAELVALRARVAELEGNLVASGAEMSRLRRDLTSAGTQVEEATTRAHKAEQLAVDVEAERRRAERAAAESAAAATESQRRAQEAETRAATAETRESEASTQLQEAMARASAAEREIEDCRAAATAAAEAAANETCEKQNMEAMRMQITATEARAAAAEAQVEAAETKATEAWTQLQEAIERAAAIESEFETYRVAMTAAESGTTQAVEASNRQAAEEAAKAAQATEEAEGARAKAAAAEQTTAVAEARAVAAEIRAIETSARLEAAESQISEVSTRLKAAESRMAETSAELEAAMVRAAAAESEMEEHRAAVAAATAEAAGRREAADAALAAAESTAAAEAERAAAAESLAASMRSRCEELERISEEGAAAAAFAAAAGPLAGARAYFDPALPAAPAAAARAALTAAGGSECAGWHGGGGCTHVVVDPAAALPYLVNARPATGVVGSTTRGVQGHATVQDLFVVTPQWLTRTAERGQRARCCVLSPDAAAAVASHAVASGVGTGTGISGGGGAGAGAGARGGAGAGGSWGFNDGEIPCQLGMKRGVEALEETAVVSDVVGRDDPKSAAAAAGAEVDRRRKAGRSHRSGTWPKSLAPKSLLEGICWAVTDAPETARWYGDGAGGGFGGKFGGIGNIDSSFTANSYGGGGGGGGGASVSFPTASQHSGGGYDSETVPLGDAARDAVVYNLPFITLLLPADRFQEVGLRSLTHRVREEERGLTVGELLRMVHEYYAAPLEPWEESELMLCDSKYASRLRASHAAGERTPRGAMLGSLRTVECLRRCSGGGSAAYEVVLIT